MFRIHLKQKRPPITNDATKCSESRTASWKLEFFQLVSVDQICKIMLRPSSSKFAKTKNGQISVKLYEQTWTDCPLNEHPRSAQDLFIKFGFNVRISGIVFERLRYFCLPTVRRRSFEFLYNFYTILESKVFSIRKSSLFLFDLANRPPNFMRFASARPSACSNKRLRWLFGT